MSLLIISDIIGMLGVLFCVVAYLLLNMRKLTTQGYPYPVMNSIGALLIIFSLTISWNLASFCMESAWLLISLFGFYKACKENQKPS